MNKVLIFILLFLAVVGFFGGLGYLLYYHLYVIAICVVALGYLAVPKLIELFKKLSQ